MQRKEYYEYLVDVETPRLKIDDNEFVKKKNDDESTKGKRGQNEDIIERLSFADIKHFNPSGRIKAGQLTEEETKILQSTRKSLAEKYTRKEMPGKKGIKTLPKSAK